MNLCISHLRLHTDYRQLKEAAQKARFAILDYVKQIIKEYFSDD